jgi:hypothetical protein
MCEVGGAVGRTVVKMYTAHLTDASGPGWLRAIQVTGRAAMSRRHNSAWGLGVLYAGKKKGGWVDIGWPGPGVMKGRLLRLKSGLFWNRQPRARKRGRILPRRIPIHRSTCSVESML